MPNNSGGESSNLLFDEDDILDTLGTKDQSSSNQQLGNGFDQIFQATGGSSAKARPQPVSASIQSAKKKQSVYDPAQYGQPVDTTEAGNALEGRILGNEAISSERKKTLFQRYVFDSYKYQQYFCISTIDIQDKIRDALWPFHPDS